MALNILCNVALRNETRLVPVYDPEDKTIIKMDLTRYPYDIRKGGKIRMVYQISRTTTVKVHVLTCKQRLPAHQQCRECYRNSHHKCRCCIFVHILKREKHENI